ncbi:hypothetical protein R3W88_019311 [Solanum pinnatisectum]|uniref:Amine oxidase domain-containing protein n=1 Tax=Solanum pinnatisectum TaxID=50273 RepID=A0AAV9KLH1_9SOLN|nr:hypothetical protein R3W88_019311 [Solanum pinnatisectum]
MALHTVPPGFLKSGSIRFIPVFPQQKMDTLKRLGFGLLNKVAMLFQYVFWNSNVDIFGHVVDDYSCRDDGKHVDEHLDKMWRLLIMYFWIRQERSGKKFSHGSTNPYCHYKNI